MIVVQAYADGLTGIRCANPDVCLRVACDPDVPGETVLMVKFPAATANPAGRDVWCDAENRDWRAGRAIAFRAKADQQTRLSVSFMDANGVAYTAWSNLAGGVWQPVEIVFADIKPNPFFQPPGANPDALLDVSDVRRIGFAPQIKEAGRITVSRFVVAEHLEPRSAA